MVPRALLAFAPTLLVLLIYASILGEGLVDLEALVGFWALVYLIKMALTNQVLPFRLLRSESARARHYHCNDMARSAAIAPIFPVIYCYFYILSRDLEPHMLGPILSYVLVGGAYCILFYSYHLAHASQALPSTKDSARLFAGHSAPALTLALVMVLSIAGTNAVVVATFAEPLDFSLAGLDPGQVRALLPWSGLAGWLGASLLSPWLYVRLFTPRPRSARTYLRGLSLFSFLFGSLIAGFEYCVLLQVLEDPALLAPSVAATAVVPILGALLSAAAAIVARFLADPEVEDLPAIKPPFYESERWQSGLFFVFCLAVFGFSLSMLEKEGLLATAIIGIVPFWAIRKRVRLERTIEARTAELQEAERALIAEQEQRIEAQEQLLEFVQGAFGKYVSHSVVDEIMANPEMVGQLGGEERVMSAYFSDIARFSTMAECLSPTELVEFVNQYLTEMCDILEAYGATIDKFEGDAILAFYGAPVFFEDHAVRACMASLDQQQRLVEMRDRLRADTTIPLALRDLQRQWEGEGRTFLKVRMGLATGSMVVGNMGSQKRTDYTMMGDTVNLAARFESGQRIYGTDIMVNEALYEQVRTQVAARRLDLIQVVGKEEAVAAYEILGRKGELSEATTSMLEFYEMGLAAYGRFEFSAALEFFRQALSVVPQDGPSVLYEDRCIEYIDQPPDDLVFRPSTK